MRRSLNILGSSALFIFVDLFYTLGVFGFYHAETFGFRKSVFWNQLLAQPDGYNFTTSPLDFFVLAFFRFNFVVASVLVLYRFGIVEKFSVLFLGADICNFSYTLIKILAFANKLNAPLLYYPGMWANILWNIVAQLALHLFWMKVLCPAFLPALAVRANQNSYEPLRHETDAGGTSTPTTFSTTAANGQANRAPRTAAEAESGTGGAEDRRSTISQIVFILRYSLHYWDWFLVGTLFLTIYAIPRIFIPLYTADVISGIVSKEQSKFWMSLFLLAGLALVSSIFGGLRGGVFMYATGLVNRLMRRDLFRSILAQEIAFFDEAKTGEILSRLTADCSTIAALISTNLNVFARNVIMLFGSFVLMFAISWRLTLVTFIAIPPIAFFTKIFGNYFDKLSEDTQTTMADANRVAEEVVGSMRTVRSFACEERECARFERQIDITLHVTKSKSLVYVVFTWMVELSNNIILVAVLCYGGHLVLNDLLTVNGVIAFLLYQVQLGENFYNLNYVFTGLMESVGASRKVFEYLNRVPKMTPNGTQRPPVHGRVEFEDVSFAYPTRRNHLALRNVSFVAEAGETIALVGPSGAGKSSVISLIEKFYECDKGRIMLDGVLIKEYDHKYYHQKVTLVAQEPVLYAGSVRYNILYGCDEGAVSEEQMIEAAKLANIHNFIMETEDGYDTNCGEKGVQMSGGQKQRIAIARALVRNPAVLILDEATSALDAESEFVIKEAIQKCSVGRTVIVIAHRLSTVESANRIIVINKGNVVQVGNHKSLIKETNGLYYSLAKKQLLGFDRDTTE